jgi:broad specificity phosphatase PhoE
MGWLTTLIREFSEEEVLAISHHLTSIAIMATLFRWSPEQFIEQDNREKPRNCSVTMFVGIPGAGHTRQGKLELASYNQIYY